MICPVLAAALIVAGFNPLSAAYDMAKTECLGQDCAWWSANGCAMTTGRSKS